MRFQSAPITSWQERPMEPTKRPDAGPNQHRGTEHADLALDRNPSAPDNAITPGVGAAGTPAQAGILQGSDETEADPVPIADPLQAAAEIDREEEERGEVRPVGVTPEPGDVTPSP
jgi:hypothetical protein